VNIVEDVIWFNKEAVEEALFYTPLFAVLESDAAFSAAPEGVSHPPKKAAPGAEWLDRVTGIAELAEAFAEAEEKSGYQLDELLRALGTKSPRNFRSQAKPTGKK
jgi:hypothetical protein